MDTYTRQRTLQRPGLYTNTGTEKRYCQKSSTIFRRTLEFLSRHSTIQHQTTSRLYSTEQHIGTIYIVSILVILFLSSTLCQVPDIMGEVKNCTNEGEQVFIELLKDRPCYKCICRNLTVQCTKKRCTTKPECDTPVKNKMHCCLQCTDCGFQRKHYNQSKAWTPTANDSCLLEYCQDGFLTRARKQCYVQCENPIRPTAGQCCPSCRGCTLDNVTYVDGSIFRPNIDLCAKCKCQNGKITCEKESCPVLPCKRINMRPRDDGCCLECAGQELRSEVGKGKCFGPEGKIMAENEKENVDECTECTCLNGTMVCNRMTCPIVIDCPTSQRVYELGECCPKCPDQVRRSCIDIEGKIHRHGVEWQQGSHVCYLCSCDNGTISCRTKKCGKEELKCEEGQVLELTPGKCCKTCVPAPGICSVYGDPHYRTFDGRPFSYQGACKYVLAKDCESMNFSVIVENNAKTTRLYSWTKSVYVKLMGTDTDGEETISLHQHLLTKINNRKVALPYRSKTITIVIERYIVKVRTKTGVSLNWDGDSFLEVGATAAYTNKLCGLCGNYNGFQRDDYIGGDQSFKLDKDSFAESWKFGDEKCSRPDYSIGAQEPCSKSLAIKIMARRKCMIFKSVEFSICYSRVNPVVYYKSCMIDSCECPANHKCACESIQAYTSACARKKIYIKWNKMLHCKKTCGRGKVYSQCGPGCRQTCKNYKRISHKPCRRTCVAGCHCPAGYAIFRRKCVRISQCESLLRSAKKTMKGPKSSRKGNSRKKRLQYFQNR